jgi:quercetin dioxygenase-like cupin family protein
MSARVVAVSLLLASAPAVAQLMPARLALDQIAAIKSAGAGAGTSGVVGIESVVLAGDPTKAGLYTIEIRVPPHTRIAAHTHRDDRTSVVVSGKWLIGYGDRAADDKAQLLVPGGFYTEPAHTPHFARTGDEPVAVLITGYGPTDTVYMEP